MPDFERLTDSLREHAAKTPEQKSWAAGYSAGKSRARLEVVVVIVAVYLTIALIGHLST